MTQLRNLQMHHGSWRARRLVPKDVRVLLGRSVLTHSLDTMDPHLAAVRAEPILLKWRAQIAAARRGNATVWGEDTEARRLAMAFRQAQKTTDRSEERALDDIIQHVIRNYAPQNADVEKVAYEQHDGDVYEAFRSLPGGRRATEMLDRLTDTTTPLETLLTAWGPHLHRNMKARQAAM